MVSDKSESESESESGDANTKEGRTEGRIGRSGKDNSPVAAIKPYFTHTG